ncbi:MAG: B12-binding domain-containing radical SAM protein [Candidatus Omnitrophica bacterium]|nr:B12-binding domain-containing radical SAM protein [Candidatus Omnitrophota bacterium]
MKIALVSPKGNFLSNNKNFREFWEESQQLQFYKRFWSGLSTGLLIVGALTPKKIKVELIDENVESIDFNKDYDLVALSTMTQQATRTYEIADEFRRRHVKVAIGGIHPTVFPEEAKGHCDSVIIGEAEEIWTQFIKDFSKGSIQSFYSSSRPANLEQSPMPRYSLLRPEDYRIVWTQTTRGCPYNCEFCVASKIFGTKFRHKSIKQVIREVKCIKSIFKNSWIGFGDDNMFVNRKYASELAKNLIPLKIRWMTQTDISIAEDENLLKLLKKSGCYILFIGFESLSKRSLGSIDKSKFKVKRLHKYRSYIKRIQNAGIGVMGAFMLGFDYDNISVFKRTADFIIDNHLYAAQITVLTPLPGTQLRQRLQQQNRLLSLGWDNYTFWDVTFTPKKMSIGQLQQGLLDVYKSVYSKDVLLENDRYFKKIYKRIN